MKKTFKEQIDTHEGQLKFFKYLVENENHHSDLEIDHIFRAMKTNFTESGVSNTLENLRVLFNSYKGVYGFYPNSPSKDLQELFEADRYSDLAWSDIELYFDLQIDGYSLELIEKFYMPQLRILKFNSGFRNTVLETRKLLPSDYEGQVKIYREFFKAQLMEQDPQENNLNYELSDEQLYEKNESNLKYPSCLKVINKALNGGYETGGLYVFTAQAKAGKSTFMANEAVSIMSTGRNVCIATFEMSAQDYAERINCNLFRIDRKDYKKAESEGRLLALLKEKRATMEAALGYKLGKVYLRRFNNTHNQEDVLKWILNVEKTQDQKVNAVIVDYINLLADKKSSKNSDNTYLKVKSIAYDLRSYGQIHEWTTITATQTNRSGNFVEEIDATHVAESHALSAQVDAMLGIVSIKNIPYQRKIQTMFNRNGEELVPTPVFMDWNYWLIKEFPETSAGEKAMNDLLSIN